MSYCQFAKLDMLRYIIVGRGVIVASAALNLDDVSDDARVDFGFNIGLYIKKVSYERFRRRKRKVWYLGHWFLVNCTLDHGVCCEYWLKSKLVGKETSIWWNGIANVLNLPIKRVGLNHGQNLFKCYNCLTS